MQHNVLDASMKAIVVARGIKTRYLKNALKEFLQIWPNVHLDLDSAGQITVTSQNTFLLLLNSHIKLTFSSLFLPTVQNSKDI